MADADALQRAHPVALDLDGVALALEGPGERLGDRRVVLGQQDRGHVRERIPRHRPSRAPSSEPARVGTDCRASHESGRHVVDARVGTIGASECAVRSSPLAPPFRTFARHFVPTRAGARDRAWEAGAVEHADLARRHLADHSPADLAPDHADDLALALRLADAADAITLDRFRAADLRVTRKPDRTPVTDADTATEDALRAVLGTERPGDAVLGEERGGELPENGRGWVLDPIDGTKNFSRGVPVWATLIGLTVHGRAVVGVASAPGAGPPLVGRRGAGRVGVGQRGPAAPDHGLRGRRPRRRLPVDHRLPHVLRRGRPRALDRAGRRLLGDAGVRRLLAVLPRRRGGDRRRRRPGGQRLGPRRARPDPRRGGRAADRPRRRRDPRRRQRAGLQRPGARRRPDALPAVAAVTPARRTADGADRPGPPGPAPHPRRRRTPAPRPPRSGPPGTGGPAPGRCAASAPR